MTRKDRNGMRVPSLKLFICICNSLEVSPEYLLSNDLVKVEKPDDKYLHIVKKFEKLSPSELETIDCLLDTYIARKESVK